MSSHPLKYNHIDAALRSQIIHLVFDEGLSYADTSEHCSYPYIKDKDANEFVQLKGVEIDLFWWLQMVVKESLHKMSHVVHVKQF